MKEKGLFKVLAFILFIIAGTTTKAQPQWTGSTLTEGSFYLLQLRCPKVLDRFQLMGNTSILGRCPHSTTNQINAFTRRTLYHING